MNIQINLDGDERPDELNAIAALIAALGGRAPSLIGYEPTEIDMPAMPPELSDAARAAIKSHGATSDELLREEAARVAGRPTGSPNTGEESPSGGSSNPEGAPDRDADGLPWDERIHSGNKATNADGTWRKRRGVDEVLYGQVVAELQEAASAGGNAPADIATVAETFTEQTENGSEPAPTAPPPPPPAASAPPPPPPSGPAPAPVSTASGAAAATTAADPMQNYRSFMKRVSQAGQTYEALDEQARMLGLAKFTDLVKNLDKVDAFAEHLEAMGLLAPVAG